MTEAVIPPLFEVGDNVESIAISVLVSLVTMFLGARAIAMGERAINRYIDKQFEYERAYS
jgi:hypothetical protein